MCKEGPATAIPKLVPDAGGCSVSVTTIKKIEVPTAIEYIKSDESNEECGINAHKEPQSKPTICPPITLLGLAVIFLGKANTINTLEPIEAIIIGLLWILKNRRTINMAKDAKML